MDYPYTRPQGEYTNTDPQQTKYQNDRAANIPVSDVKIDGDFNKLTDAVNDLKDKIDDAVIAGIDGATDPDNQGKLVSTSGTEINWIYAGTDQIIDRAITFAKIQSGTHGALLAYDNTQTLSEIDVGNQGEVLTSNGAAQKPTYQTLASLFDSGANQNKVLISQGANVGFSFVTNNQIEDNTISGGKITDASIVANVKLQDLSISNTKIANNIITVDKLRSPGYAGFIVGNMDNYTYSALKYAGAAVSVDDWKIPTKTSGSTTITLAALTSFWDASTATFTGAKLTNQTITTDKIADSNVTNAKLATDAVKTANIVGENVTEAKIATDAITTTKIADNNVTNNKLASGISTSKLSGTARQIIATNDAGAGTSIALNTTTNKVLCSKTAAPYAEFRSLTQNDLPQIGMQPVYMARWYNNAVTKSYQMPNTNFVTSFSQGAGSLAGGMILTFNQSPNNFIVMVNGSDVQSSQITIYRNGQQTGLGVNQVSFYSAGNQGCVLIYKPS